jgi:hypothetical protein
MQIVAQEQPTLIERVESIEAKLEAFAEAINYLSEMVDQL